MLTLAIVFTLGAFMNMYRGGLLPKTKLFSGQLDIINALVFGVMVAYLVAGLNFGPELYLAFIWSFILMMRWATPAWGPYLGALLYRSRPDGRAGVGYIDKIIEDLLPGSLTRWGIAGTSLRLGEWGLYLGAPFMTFYPMLVGLAAGPLLAVFGVLYNRYIYKRPIVFNEKGAVEGHYGWKIFEAVFGGSLWVAVAIGVGYIN